MLISHRHRFIFIHNPKAGGTAIRKALRGFAEEPDRFWHQKYLPRLDRVVDLAHLELSELEDLDSVRGYGAFMVVREPIQRFLSALSEHCRQHNRRLRGPEAVNDFIEKEITFGNLHYDWKYVHFRPQYRFMWQPTDRYSIHVIIVRHESLSEKWESIPIYLNTIEKAQRNVPDFPALPKERVRPDVEKFRVEDLTLPSLSKLVRLYSRDFKDFSYELPVTITSDGTHACNIEMIHRDYLTPYLERRLLSSGEQIALKNKEAEKGMVENK